MANGVRINNLNQATSLSDTDTMTIIQDNENKKASISLLDKDGTYTQSVVNTIPDLITTSKANVETTKQAIDEKFSYDEFSAQIVTSQAMSSIGVSDDVSVDVNSQVQDGFMESAILKGQTLVNVYDYTLSTFIGGATIENGVITFKANGGWVVVNNKLPMLKPNTNYTVFVNILSNTLTYSSSSNNYALQIEGDNGNTGFNSGYQIPKNSVGIFKKLLTTKESFSTTHLSDVRVHESANGGEIKFTYMIIEGDHTQEDIPYFEGMQSVKMPILSTVGKNLFDGLSYIDGFIAQGNNYTVSSDNDVTSILVNVNKNTDYILSAKTNFSRSIVGGSLTPISIGTKTTNLNSERVGNTIKFNSGIYTNIIIYLSETKINIEDIQVEEGSISTTYEPYKTSILSCNEDVTLRKIGNVRDELNLLTGEVTERIGEMVLNGSENWSVLANYSNGDCKAYSLTINDYTSNIVCDRLKILPNDLKFGTEEGVFVNNNLLVVKKNITTIELFKQWLSQNPLTVQYRLETESIKTVDLNSSNGDVKTPVIYKNGHILLQSDGLIPELHYSLPISYSGLIAQNTMTNLKHSWRLDELEIMAYTSIVNSQYESLILVATAETNEVVVSSEYVPDESLYNMLKVLVNANALVNADEKINVFYLYGKLSDEMYIDLIIGDDMQ